MNHILLLIKSYFYKTKGQTVSLIMLIMIAVMLLNIGLIMQIGIVTFFDERAEELNSGHFSVIAGPAIVDINEVEQFLMNHESVVEMEQRDILFSQGDIFIGDHGLGQFLLLERSDSAVAMNPLSLIGDYLPLEDDVIYIPHFLMVDNAFEIGDRMRLVFAGEEIWFTVGGSTEEILMGTMMNGGIRFYISDEKFQELQTEFPEVIHPLMTGRLESAEDSNLVLNDINNVTFTLNEKEDGLILFPMTYEFARVSRTFMPTIIGITAVALAGILLIISAVVVRFRINSNIEESIKNIGILKAMGYRNSQIIQSILLQFVTITLAGGVLGVILAIIIMPLVASVMEGQIGLIWQPGIDLLTGILTVSLAIGFILLLAYLSASRIKKLYPLTALRDGITTHSFKKNYFPLEKMRRSFIMALSLKQVFQNKKQLLMVTLIVIGLTFSAVASLTIYYNMVVNNETFGNTIGGIVSDVSVVVEDDDYLEIVRRRLEEAPEIVQLSGRNSGGLRADVNDVNLTLVVVEETEDLGTHMLVDGRFPIHANEIAVSPVLINMEGFEVGTTVTLNRDEQEFEFLITGVVQMMQDLGFFSILSGEAMRRVDPDFTFRMFDVNLVAGADVDEFIDLIEASDGDVIRTFNVRKDLDAMLDGMSATVTPVAFGNVAVTAVVITLVLYMVIKTMIMRRHKELGIQKALGFTNSQLMNQIALNLLPVIVIGTIIGVVVGYFSFNLIFITMMSGTGIATADLPTPIAWVIILAIGMAVLSYAVAILIARKIRKISAYGLVSE